MSKKYARYGSLVERDPWRPRKWVKLDEAIVAAIGRTPGLQKLQITLRVRRVLPSYMDAEGREVSALINNRLTQLRKWGLVRAEGTNRALAKWFTTKGNRQ